MNRPSPSSAKRLKALLADCEHLLLDFDGPVCRLFAGRPADGVAERLLHLLPAALSEKVASSDPHEILRQVQARNPVWAVAVEAALSDEESEAAATAVPTPCANQLITTAHDTDRTVSIVTNNSPKAVEIYLALHGLTRYVDAVAARAPDGVGRMKPHPALVQQALNEVAACPTRAVLVGNSPSDVEAAGSAGVESIGFLDGPTKRRCLATATALVTNLAELVDALRPQADGRRVSPVAGGVWRRPSVSRPQAGRLVAEARGGADVAVADVDDHGETGPYAAFDLAGGDVGALLYPGAGSVGSGH